MLLVEELICSHGVAPSSVLPSHYDKISIMSLVSLVYTCQNHLILWMRSIVTSKNVSWSRLIGPTLYIIFSLFLTLQYDALICIRVK